MIVIENPSADFVLPNSSGVNLPESSEGDLLDFKVRVDSGAYEPWSDSVPRMEIESHRGYGSPFRRT